MKPIRYFFMFVFMFIFMFASCKTQHNVSVDVNKPIKIEARVDIYLHAETIEDMVSGKEPIPDTPSKDNEKQSFLMNILRNTIEENCIWAAPIPFKNFTEEIKNTIIRRKNRFKKIKNLISSGKIKEGKKGYLVVVGKLDKKEKKLVEEENKDREYLYKELAKQNNMKLEEVEKAFGKVHTEKKGKK